MSDRYPDRVSNESSSESDSLARQLRWIIGIRLVVITSVGLPAVLFQVSSLSEEPAPTSLYGLAALAYATAA